MKKIIIVLILLLNISFAKDGYFRIKTKENEKNGIYIYEHCSKRLKEHLEVDFNFEIGFDNKKLSYYDLKINKSNDYSNEAIKSINDFLICSVEYYLTNEDFIKNILTSQKSFIGYVVSIKKSSD
ncbi:hypothetical protein AFAEC_1136 [Aliarcobacter faecis]|uniref:hypothetical protein n=1 Tax=Aliarcobacter faecis TaxID=1564138 RepID=UPI00047884B7|nr:hypothetical protein [Aliarcobacter faecis]QKF73302.1 hypothetical protein AFAEC_1136 [Aliarcobacter faecis]